MRKFHFNFLQSYLALNLLGLLLFAVHGFFAARAALNRPQQMVLGGMFFLAVLAGLGVFLLRQPERAERTGVRMLNSRWLKTILAVLFGIFWSLTWTPAEKSGSFFYYYAALLPFFAWMSFASASGYLFVLAGKGQLVRRELWLCQKKVFLTAGVAALGALLVVGLAFGLKIQQNSDVYWYGAGVPLLTWQVFAALALYVALENLPIRLPRQRIIYFFLIWAISAWMWASAPVQDSFFVGRLLPPNNEHYPFADLEVFDVGSQFALIGQGLNNNVYFDRALYMAFLVYLHTFFGQDYALVMTAQAVLYAIFPALVFLLGERLHSRNAGLILGLLIAFRGLNGLAAMGWINTSTQKHMLTDFPTALGLIILLLLVLRWLENPEREWRSLGWAGGALGLTSMLRPHVLFLLIGLIPLVLWAYRARLRQGLAVSVLLLAAFGASMLPWGLGNGSGQTLIDMYILRFQNLIEQRYDPGSFLPHGSAHLARLANTPPVQVPFVFSHFLNNLITSTLGLPTTPRFVTVSEVVRAEMDNYWHSDWNGSLSPEGAGMFTLNLGLVCLGLGQAWQTQRKQSVALLGMFLLYLMANSLARTSGGRYIVPVDWVVTVYFGLGCVTLYRFLFAPLEAESSVGELVRSARQPGKFSWALGSLGVLAGLGFLGALIPLAGHLHPIRYESQTKVELLVALQPYLTVTSLEARQFLRTPDSVILHGRALYPRFLDQGWGLGLNALAFRNLMYPRTVFTLIGPQGSVFVLLPGPSPDYFPNASDVVVLGCRTVTDSIRPTVEAAAILLSKDGVAIQRHPQVPLACPMPEPVCNNNGTCR